MLRRTVGAQFQSTSLRQMQKIGPDIHFRGGWFTDQNAGAQVMNAAYKMQFGSEGLLMRGMNTREFDSWKTTFPPMMPGASGGLPSRGNPICFQNGTVNVNESLKRLNRHQEHSGDVSGTSTTDSFLCVFPIKSLLGGVAANQVVQVFDPALLNPFCCLTQGTIATWRRQQTMDHTWESETTLVHTPPLSMPFSIARRGVGLELTTNPAYIDSKVLSSPSAKANGLPEQAKTAAFAYSLACMTHHEPNGSFPHVTPQEANRLQLEALHSYHEHLLAETPMDNPSRRTFLEQQIQEIATYRDRLPEVSDAKVQAISQTMKACEAQFVEECKNRVPPSSSPRP